MNTSTFNGLNVGKLHFTHFATVTFFTGRGSEFYAKQAKKFFSALKQINSIYYSIERSKLYNDYHLHLLINCKNHSKMIQNVKHFFNATSINEVQRLVLVKKEKTFNPDNSPIRYQDVLVNSIAQEISGKIGKCHIEKIISLQSVAYYINKYTSRGITTDYWEK